MDPYEDVLNVELFVLAHVRVIQTRKNELTGSMDCKTSLRMLPQKKNMKIVRIAARWRQSQTRRASLHQPVSDHDSIRRFGLTLPRQ